MAIPCFLFYHQPNQISKMKDWKIEASSVAKLKYLIFKKNFERTFQNNICGIRFSMVHKLLFSWYKIRTHSNKEIPPRMDDLSPHPKKNNSFKFMNALTRFNWVFYIIVLLERAVFNNYK